MSGEGPPIAIGAWHWYTAEDRRLAGQIADGQHANSGPRGTRFPRGEGSSWELRYRGALGEIAVARMLGIVPQVRVEARPSLRPDIILEDGTVIEVKAGLPLAAIKGLRPEAWHVAVSKDATPGWALVHHVALGANIIRRGEHPLASFMSRKGTERENYWFGTPATSPRRRPI